MINQSYFEHIYQALYSQYESTVYDLPVRHQKSCLRLLNAANKLYNNALRILRNQSSLIMQDHTPLTLQQNQKLLLDIYLIATDPEKASLLLKFVAVKNLLQRDNIYPNLLRAF